MNSTITQIRLKMLDPGGDFKNPNFEAWTVPDRA